MEACYEIKLILKRMISPDKTGVGPFIYIEDEEYGAKIIIYPDILNNPTAVNCIVKEFIQTFEKVLNKNLSQAP